MPVDRPAAVAAEDPGAVLRAARVAAGLTVSEAARRLKLTVRVVEGIEDNDRQRMPPAVYMRGFVRNYARLLGLDAELLLKAYAQEQPPPPKPRDNNTRSLRMGRMSPADGFSFGKILPLAVVGGLALVVLLGVLFWLWRADQHLNLGDAGGAPAPVEAGSDARAGQGDGSREPHPRTDGQTDVTAAAVLSEENDGANDSGSGGQAATETAAVRSDAPAAERAERAAVEGWPDAEPGGAVPAGVASTRGDAGEFARGTAGADVAQPAAGFTRNEWPATDDPPIVSRLTTVGDEQLRFEFTEDCWVEIFDTEGEVLYQNLLRRRQTLFLIGAGPFQIRLGYAPGVTLAYNGEPVPLAPHTQNNVASLVVGQ